MDRKIFDLDARTAIVTGASKGIGEAVARGLAAFGARVVVSSRKQESVEEVAARIGEDGGAALAVACHVGDPSAREALVARAVEAFGGVDILVNNAAANPVHGPTLEVEPAAFDKILDVNLRAPFELSRLVHPVMAARGGGSIINVSSIGGVSPEPDLGIYSVSKAALISLTRVLASEWGANGIRVNAVAPGLVKTKFSRALWSDEATLERVVGRLPLARIGVPEDLVGLCVFLASEASSFCTGGVYLADGGHTI